MKKYLRVLLVILLFSIVTGIMPYSAHALLIRTVVDSTFVVVDDVNEVQWADVTRFTDLTFSELISEINAMNAAVFAGASDWHLASSAEVENLFDQVITVGDARQFDPTLGGGSDSYSTLGRYDQIGAYASTHQGARWYYDNDLGDESTEIFKELTTTNYVDDYSNSRLGAFVVSSASVPSPVPEPATLLLLGSGLLGLARFRKKLRK